MKEKRLHVALGEDSYDILIAKGLLDQVGQRIKTVFQGQRILVLTDAHVDPLYGDRVETSLKEAGFVTARLVLPPGEGTKAFATLPCIYQALLKFGCTRTDMLLALGGGVIGDLGGFAASTYLRGIAFVQVPTSLLAQVDSSIGGKVAVDLPQGKNLVGSFYQPKMVLMDPLVLETLPSRYFADGMGEVIKYGCILDAVFLEQLAQGTATIEDILYTCCDWKRKIVEADTHDWGARALLNFGHTLGHGIEQAEQYAGHSHGEAVAIGMAQITRISEQQGLTVPGTAEQLQKILQKYKLPYAMPAVDKAQVLQALTHDKKRSGDTLKVVILKRLGEAMLYTTTPAFFAEVLQ